MTGRVVFWIAGRGKGFALKIVVVTAGLVCAAGGAAISAISYKLGEMKAKKEAEEDKKEGEC